MLQIAICDDNKLHLEHEKSLVSKALAAYSNEIELFTSAEELLGSIDCGDYTPDIAILDIEMDGMNGIELGKKINAILPECRIIYLTGYLNYAPDVYATEHVWFVLKERIEDGIVPALLKAVSSSPADRNTPLGLLAKVGRKTSFIPLRDVMYIERTGRKCRIVTANGDILVPRSPDSLLKGPASEVFIHCHQSYWINIQKIAALDRADFVLTDGTRIHISRTYLVESRAKFFELYRKA